LRPQGYSFPKPQDHFVTILAKFFFSFKGSDQVEPQKVRNYEELLTNVSKFWIKKYECHKLILLSQSASEYFLQH